jgi:hypothetical protein
MTTITDGRCGVGGGGGGSCGAATAEGAAESMKTTTYKWETWKTSAHFYPRHQVPVNGLIIKVKIRDAYCKASRILSYFNDNWDVNKIQ